MLHTCIDTSNPFGERLRITLHLSNSFSNYSLGRGWALPIRSVWYCVHSSRACCVIKPGHQRVRLSLLPQAPQAAVNVGPAVQALCHYKPSSETPLTLSLQESNTITLPRSSCLNDSIRREGTLEEPLSC